MASVSTSVFAIQQTLDEQLEKKEWNDALILIQRTVERVIDEPLCTAQVFASDFLDDYCQRIGAQSLLKLANHPIKPSGKTRVYLATKLQKSGGHTRVLEDLIRSAPDDLKHIVLSTELVGNSDRDALKQNLTGQKVTFEWNEDPTPMQKLLWLQKRLREIAPESVWLFNHHQDSTIIAAAQPKQGYTTYFLHHADHHLCLGVHRPEAIHIDPLPMGFHHCRMQLGLSNNVYLPLWMKDGGARPDPATFKKNDIITTCTAAGFNKVEVPYFISYIEMIPEIIKATGGRHIHIGKLTPWALRKIKRALKQQNIDPTSFSYKPWEPSIWKALQRDHVDLYIASFPYGGARTLIEAMGSGTPVTVHNHYATRAVSCIDVVYPDAFIWRDPNDFYAFLKGLSVPFLKEQSKIARSFYLKYHDASQFENFNINKLRDLSPPTLRQHDVDLLQWGLGVAHQINLYGLVWRFLYRHRRVIKKLLRRN